MGRTNVGGHFANRSQHGQFRRETHPGRVSRPCEEIVRRTRKRRHRASFREQGAGQRTGRLVARAAGGAVVEGVVPVCASSGQRGSENPYRYVLAAVRVVKRQKRGPSGSNRKRVPRGVVGVWAVCRKRNRRSCRRWRLASRLVSDYREGAAGSDLPHWPATTLPSTVRMPQFRPETAPGHVLAALMRKCSIDAKTAPQGQRESKRWVFEETGRPDVAAST